MHKKRFHLPLSFIPTLLLLILFVSLFLFLKQRYRKVVWIPSQLTETSSSIKNPYCGWYHIYGYQLTDTPVYTKESIEASRKGDLDTTLALLQFNLNQYSASPISDAALEQLDTIFSVWDSFDCQLIVRFLYDWDGNATQTEPTDIETILTHMTQVGEIINRHASTIFLLQGIFVGNYGEMNNSIHLDDSSIKTLITHLSNVTDSSIFLSVRTPSMLRSITDSIDPITQSAAYNGTLAARLGLFNDGLLGSDTDLGTYGTIPKISSTQTNDRWTKEDELAFQSMLCQYVPNGGEVVIDNPLNDLSSAIETFYQMHLSYLNSVYDPAVIQKWENTKYSSNDIFNGISGEEFMKSHLGYRYVLSHASLSFHPIFDRSATFSVSIKNVGFANSYKKFNVFLKLVNQETKDVSSIPVHTDTRTWLSRQTTTLSIPLDLRSLIPGRYDFYLQTETFDQKQNIYYGNTGYDASYGYLLGSASIEKLAK